MVLGVRNHLYCRTFQNVVITNVHRDLFNCLGLTRKSTSIPCTVARVSLGHHVSLPSEGHGHRHITWVVARGIGGMEYEGTADVSRITDTQGVCHHTVVVVTYGRHRHGNEQPMVHTSFQDVKYSNLRVKQALPKSRERSRGYE